MMTPGLVDFTLEERLAALTVHDAPPERIGGVRARCLSELARRRRRSGARRQWIAVWKVRLETAAATGLGALYLAGALERALDVLR